MVLAWHPEYLSFHKRTPSLPCSLSLSLLRPQAVLVLFNEYLLSFVLSCHPRTMIGLSPCTSSPLLTFCLTPLSIFRRFWRRCWSELCLSYLQHLLLDHVLVQPCRCAGVCRPLCLLLRSPHWHLPLLQEGLSWVSQLLSSVVAFLVPSSIMFAQCVVVLVAVLLLLV